MKEYKTLFEKYSDDILTDNTQIPKYEQCKDCRYQSDGTVYSNYYQKGHCYIYSYADGQRKPNGIFDGSEKCKYYKEQ